MKFTSLVKVNICQCKVHRWSEFVSVYFADNIIYWQT